MLSFSSFSYGNVPGFTPEVYLELNPGLAKRYLTEQHRNGLRESEHYKEGRLVDPGWLGKRNGWLHALVRVSIVGAEKGLSWVKGAPLDFNWKTYAKLNPHLEGRFATEQKRLNSKLTDVDLGTFKWQAKRAYWYQRLAIVSLTGKEKGLSWIEGVPTGFDWKTYLELNPHLETRYLTEQAKNGLKREAHYTEGHLTDPVWAAKRAAWLQALVKTSLVGRESPLPWVRGVSKDFNWRTYIDSESPDVVVYRQKYTRGELAQWAQEQAVKKLLVPVVPPQFFIDDAKLRPSFEIEGKKYYFYDVRPDGICWSNAGRMDLPYARSILRRFTNKQITEALPPSLKGDPRFKHSKFEDIRKRVNGDEFDTLFAINVQLLHFLGKTANVAFHTLIPEVGIVECDKRDIAPELDGKDLPRVHIVEKRQGHYDSLIAADDKLGRIQARAIEILSEVNSKPNLFTIGEFLVDGVKPELIANQYKGALKKRLLALQLSPLMNYDAFFQELERITRDEIYTMFTIPGAAERMLKEFGLIK